MITPVSAKRVAIVHPTQTPPGIWVLATFQLTTLTLLAIAASCLVIGGLSFPLSALGLMTLHLITTGLLVPTTLAAAVQLTLALRQAPPPAAAGGWQWLPLVWLAGNLLPFGFLVGPWLLAASGASLLIAATAVAWRLLPLLANGRGLGPALRLGLAIGVMGNVLVLASGSLLALSLAGLPTALARVGLHLTLALGFAYVPLLIGVSGQLFPMFGHLSPDRRPDIRTGLVATVAVGGLVTAGASLLGGPAWRDAGAVVVALAIAGWVARQEILRSHNRSR